MLHSHMLQLWEFVVGQIQFALLNLSKFQALGRTWTCTQINSSNHWDLLVHKEPDEKTGSSVTSLLLI